MIAPPLVAEVGQLPTDPASETLVVVVVASALAAVALATSGTGSSTVSSSGVSGSGVAVTRRGVSIAAVLAVLLSVAGSVAGVSAVVSSAGGGWGRGLERGGLDGGLLDDGILLVQDLLNIRGRSLALGASFLHVGGDGGLEVLLVLRDLLVDTVFGLRGGDLGGDVCLGGGAGLLDGEASTEGTGQGVVSAADCADVSS